MPNKEQVTSQKEIMVMNATIGSDTTTAGSIIDTADFDGGLYLSMLAQAYTDGDYALIIHDGDDSALSDAALVDSSQLVYGTLPSLGAATAALGQLLREGVIATKRYVRPSIVSTNFSSGGAQIVIMATLGAELMPVPQPADT